MFAAITAAIEGAKTINLTFHHFVIMFAAITAAIEGAKTIKLTLHPFWIYLSVINFIVEVSAQIFIAYKFPILFISWTVIQDPLVQKIVKLLYKKYYNI